MTGVSSHFLYTKPINQKGDDTMKNWHRLFIRQGFNVKEVSRDVFDCHHETAENIEFLLESLQKLSLVHSYEKGILTVLSPVISEEKWLNTVDYEHRGRGGFLWFRPGQDEPKIRELDTYISGVVREFNRLGLHTTISCDGHGRQNPLLGFAEWVDMEKVITVLQAAGVKRVNPRRREFRLAIQREQLLDIAEKLHLIQNDWLSNDVEFIQKQLFLPLLEQCLSIQGESGKEEIIRQFVLEKLRPQVDHVTVDRTGNILAQKTYGHGDGPTILLNAHLDTAYELEKDRKIVKEGAIWSSSAGILGADDRAGIAVLLELSERLKGIRFNGKVKYIFTVEEEIGLVGASLIDDYFLWDIDAAFVVDRRGMGDIVTSCGGYERFCDGSFGSFIENVANTNGLPGWKCTVGGSSDTRIWASYCIQSVNLSVGYQNEHTASETLDVNACYHTLELLLAVFKQARELEGVVNNLKKSEKTSSNYKRING
jgi:tripeptide aminopeptidase